MRNRLPVSTRSSTRWPLWAAGAALGVLASWWMLRRLGAVPNPARNPARGGRGPSAPDLDAIAARLRARPGADDLRVRSLGGGILELVGRASDALDLPAALDALAAEPGVSVVVNRAWSAGSGQP